VHKHGLAYVVIFFAKNTQKNRQHTQAGYAGVMCIVKLDNET